MGFKFLKITAVSFFFASASLMAQSSTFETIQHNENMGYYDAYNVTENWSKDLTVQGYNVHVGVVAYANGSSNIDIPDKILNGMNYIVIDGCTYSTTSKELKCDYEIYNYKETVTESEPTFFDVMFFREVSHDVYEKGASGSFSIKRP